MIFQEYPDSYSSVDPEVNDIVDRLIEQKATGKIFYFNPRNEVDEETGSITGIRKTKGGLFLEIRNALNVRLDKVITFYGRPGPAYDAYERFANACLACNDDPED